MLANKIIHIMLCLRHHCRKYTLCSAAFKLHGYKMIHAFTLFITFFLNKAYTATMLTFSQTIFSPQTTSQHKLLYLEAKRNQHFSPLINPCGHTNNNNNSIDSGTKFCSGCWGEKNLGACRDHLETMKWEHSILYRLGLKTTK